MKIVVLIVAVFILGLFLGNYIFEPYGKAVSDTVYVGSPYEPGELIVKFKPGVVSIPGNANEAAITKVHVSSGVIKGINRNVKAGSVKRLIDLENDAENHFKDTFIIRLPDNANVPMIARMYKNSGQVEYAEPNYLAIDAFAVDDPMFPRQWNLQKNKLNAEEAWNLSLGYYENGSSPIIAVVDNGVKYDHPDIIGNYIGGYDYGDGDNDPMDVNGHGTGVAGILIGVANNGQGIAGGCPGCKLYVAKCSNSEARCKLSDGANAIIGAAHAGASVISVSKTWYCSECKIYGDCSDTCGTIIGAMDHMWQFHQGVLVVAAAGNACKDFSDARSWPAASINALTVGATNKDDGVAAGITWCSNTDKYSKTPSAYIDVAAPGIDICTTTWDGSYSCGDWATSGATPQVSALAGLLKAKRPDLNYGGMFEIIRIGVDTLPPGVKLGEGRVNYENSLSFLAPNVLQRCCVANIDQSIGWKHESNTKDYVITNTDSDARTCATWFNNFEFSAGYCSDSDALDLPLHEEPLITRAAFDDSPAICDKYRWRFNYPAKHEFYLSRQNPKMTVLGGRSDDPGLILALDFNAESKLSSINYHLNPPSNYYGWDLSCCHGTIDDDGDGWYVDDNCKGARDCNDNRIWINPSATEYCGDNIDENCNGQVSEAGCVDPASITILPKLQSPYKNLPALI